MAHNVLDPGPRDRSVLTLQAMHRSTNIFEGEELSVFRCHRHDIKIWRDTPGLAHPRVLYYLKELGIYGIYRIGQIRLDVKLISALVERWRQETHTFHLPFGETTITLQDVSILTGLHIDGTVVTGSDPSYTLEQWQDIFWRLFGIAPPDEAFLKNRFRLNFFDHYYRDFYLDEDADDVVVQQFVRGQLLRIIGGAILPDISDYYVKLMYVPLLEDLRAFACYSWGSATLASLYRGLCRGTSPLQTEIGGYLPLLQIWAWERFPIFRPTRLDTPEAPHMEADDTGHVDAPWGHRWNARYNLKNVTTHTLRAYRNQLDVLDDNPQRFIWFPYTSDVVSILPSSCFLGSDLWTACIPLICFDVVEWHFPDRVMRQFGCVQYIPAPCDTSLRLHQIDRRERSHSTWNAVHTAHIAAWNERHHNIVTGEPIVAGVAYSLYYMEWYRRITRICIGRISYPTPGYEGKAVSYEFLHERFQQINLDLDRALNSTSEADRYQILRDMKAMVRNTLDVIGQGHVRSTPAAARGDTVPATTLSPFYFSSPYLRGSSQMTQAGEGTSGTHGNMGLRLDEIADTDITPVGEDVTHFNADVHMPDFGHHGSIPMQEGISHVIEEEPRPMVTYVRRSRRVRRPPAHGCNT